METFQQLFSRNNELIPLIQHSPKSIPIKISQKIRIAVKKIVEHRKLTKNRSSKQSNNK
jgi:hypothetical protein